MRTTERLISRRGLLSGLVAIAAAPLLWPVRVGAASASATPVGSPLLLTPWSRAPRLGAAYLEGHPEEASAGALEAALRRTPGVRLDRGPQALRRSLARAVAADFERGDSVPLQGWQLSRTECRLAALAALQPGRAERGA